MRILFMGTPDIAAESLAALLDAGHEVCGVFTRRDKPVGRKQILTAPPVKQLAVEHGLSVYQPRTLRDGSSDELIKELAPDIIVVVAYGCIIPPQLLHAAKYGCINLHVSLLPKYRGSAPIQWAVLNGDEGTGVTIMQLDEGLDTGDILMVEPVTISPEETSGELFDRVSAVGAGTLVTALEKIEAGPRAPMYAHELIIGAKCAPGYDPFASLQKAALAEYGGNECPMFVCHPGYIDDYLIHHSSLVDPRPMEVAMATSPATKQWLKDHDVTVVTYDEL